jgi:hypothetical protein
MMTGVSNALAVDPFRAALDEGSMAGLRERLARSRLALPESDGWRRGVPGRWLSALLADWQAFDVSRFQARLTHLRANLDGQLVHLVHMPGRGPDPIPLLLTHGQPQEDTVTRAVPYQPPQGSTAVTAMTANSSVR